MKKELTKEQIKKLKAAKKSKVDNETVINK